MELRTYYDCSNLFLFIQQSLSRCETGHPQCAENIYGSFNGVRPERSVLRRLQHLLRVRTSHTAFHPDTPQSPVHLHSFPSLFILRRAVFGKARDGVVCITNFSDVEARMPGHAVVTLLGELARAGGGMCRDLLDEAAFVAADEVCCLFPCTRSSTYFYQNVH